MDRTEIISSSGRNEETEQDPKDDSVTALGSKTFRGRL